MAYGKLLPLKKPSPFGELEMLQTLIKHSGGVTGRITWLIGRAAEMAIEDGSEQINAASLDRVNERQRVVAV